MAGQLTIDTLKASTGVLATQNGMTGIPKAWVKGEMSTATIYSAFNVSSITRTSTGVMQINFTTAMPSTAYGYYASCPIDNSSNSMFIGRYGGGTTNTTTFCLGSFRNNVGFFDVEFSAAFCAA